MKATIVRIDDRLIHGQVIVGWTRSVGVTYILVVDDVTAKDKIQCSLLRMATPAGIKSEILSVEAAVEKLNADAYKSENLMILVRGPQTIIGLMDGGVEIPSLNIGNLRSAPDKIKILSYVYATPEELNAWKELDRRNVKMTGQILPDQAKTDFNDILKKL